MGDKKIVWKRNGERGKLAKRRRFWKVVKNPPLLPSAASFGTLPDAPRLEFVQHFFCTLPFFVLCFEFEQMLGTSMSFVYVLGDAREFH